MSDAIKQGTTPSLTIKIKSSDFAVSEVVKLRLVFDNNNGPLMKKNLEDVTVDVGQNAFIYTFTEQETFAFSPKFALTVDGRAVFANGRSVGIDEMDFVIKENKDKDVLTE